MRRDAQPVALALGGMLALWLVALSAVWGAFFVFVGTPLGMIVTAVAWQALLVAVIALGVMSRRRWLLVTGIGVTLVLFAATYNWSAVAPRAYFELRRPIYDHAVRVTETDDSYYGVRLPLLLRPLSANGRVADQNGMLVFPQWLGIPDDGGGYIWSPAGPPDVDMFGAGCVAPIDLGDGWWMCLMGD